MKTNLSSKMWPATAEKIRKCHVGQLNNSVSFEEWKDAFASLIATIKDERNSYPEFARELKDLNTDTDFSYDFKDIFEEYFDHLESTQKWDEVIKDCDTLIKTFHWDNANPSEYMYRIGNAYMNSNQMDKAEAFGKQWLEEYPTDYYAAASNAFLLIKLNKLDEAKALTEKYLKKDLICDDVTNTFFMAANELFDITKDPDAKARVEEKIEEYEKLTQK